MTDAIKSEIEKYVGGVRKAQTWIAEREEQSGIVGMDPLDEAYPPKLLAARRRICEFEAVLIGLRAQAREASGGLPLPVAAEAMSPVRIAFEAGKGRLNIVEIIVGSVGASWFEHSKIRIYENAYWNSDLGKGERYGTEAQAWDNAIREAERQLAGFRAAYPFAQNAYDWLEVEARQRGIMFQSRPTALVGEKPAANYRHSSEAEHPPDTPEGAWLRDLDAWNAGRVVA